MSDVQLERLVENIHRSGILTRPQPQRRPITQADVREDDGRYLEALRATGVRWSGRQASGR